MYVIFDGMSLSFGRGKLKFRPWFLGVNANFGRGDHTYTGSVTIVLQREWDDWLELETPLSQ